MNTTMNTQPAPITNVVFDFATLLPHQKDFMLWLYTQVYNAETGLWLNGNTAPTIEFTRSWIRSMCRTFGYSGTIHWLVRKRFGRRTQRGTYQIPELAQIHTMLQTGQITRTSVTTRKNHTVQIWTPKKG